MVPHSDFDLHFSDKELCRASFHVFVSHLYDDVWFPHTSWYVSSYICLIIHMFHTYIPYICLETYVFHISYDHDVWSYDERVSWCLETSLLLLPPQDGTLSLTLFLSFYILYFVLPPFEDNGLPFWVPGILCQHSKVVLWNLLSVQMIFRWICGGESGFPILFLCHLRTDPLTYISLTPHFSAL